MCPALDAAPVLSLLYCLSCVCLLCCLSCACFSCAVFVFCQIVVVAKTASELNCACAAGVFCSGCSKNQFKLADTLGQNPELKRVCDECFEELEAVDARTLSTWDTVSASKQGP